MFSLRLSAYVMLKGLCDTFAVGVFAVGSQPTIGADAKGDGQTYVAGGVGIFSGRECV